MDARTEEHVAMVATLAKDGDAILETMTRNKMHIMHMAIGIVGEAGEIMEALHTDLLKSYDERRNNLIEELGDYEFYLEGFRQGIDVTYTDLTTQTATTDDKTGNQYCRDMSILLAMHSAHLLDCVKKYCIYNKPELPMVKLGEHMFHIEHALREIREFIDISRGAILAANTIKLTKGTDKIKPRYEGGVYSDNAAQERADKA